MLFTETEQACILWRRDDSTYEVIKPAVRYLEDELRHTPCPYLQGLRVYEIDIVRNVSLMNEFTSEPLVEDMLDRM